MFLKHVRDIAKPQHFAIIDLLKRSTGMPVAELSRALGMSYMGVKQHCLDLEKKGWLDTWRRPVPNGRPEKLYRLTTKGAALFPEAGSEVMLEMMRSMSDIFGPSAPEKLLFSYFQKKTSLFEKRLKGAGTLEKAAHFAKLRNTEGHCAELEFNPETGELSLVEWHNPHQAIALSYPSFHRHEEQMIHRLLGTQVRREEQRVSGLTRIHFYLPALTAEEIHAFLATPEGSKVKRPQKELPAVEAFAEEIAEHEENEAISAEQEFAKEQPIAPATEIEAPTPAPQSSEESMPADERLFPSCEAAAAEAALAQRALNAPRLARRTVQPEPATVDELPLFSRFAAQQELQEEVMSN